jgi:hypothetical protein
MFDIKPQVNRTSCGTEENCYRRFQFVTRGMEKTADLLKAFSQNDLRPGGLVQACVWLSV